VSRAHVPRPLGFDWFRSVSIGLCLALQPRKIHARVALTVCSLISCMVALAEDSEARSEAPTRESVGLISPATTLLRDNQFPSVSWWDGYPHWTGSNAKCGMSRMK
jgi:hypothetical protein